MSISTPITAEQLLALPQPCDGSRQELVAGELRMMSPSGWKHGQIVANLQGRLWDHVRKQRLGVVFGAETGFLLACDPDTVRAPDAAFIARENLPAEEPEQAYWPGAPDLAVEVLSPGDLRREVEEKTAAWLAAGCREVWLLDPPRRTVAVHRHSRPPRTLTAADVLESGELLPGFSCPVQALFAPLSAL